MDYTGLRGWGRSQSSTYSEYVHVANQIKRNDPCINMVANILLIDPLPGPWGGGQKVKIQPFQNMVMLHINLKGITNAAACKHIFYPTHTLHPCGGVKGHIGMEHRALCKHILCPNTHPRPQVWGQKIKTKHLKVRY